jgi:hypothetical protein
MNLKTKWNRWILGVAAVLTLTLGMAAVYPQVSEAADDTPATEQSRGWGERGSGDDELLAEALGITVEDLEAAQASAQAAGLAQAVEEGRITQEQADQMQARQALRPYLQDRMRAAYTEAVERALKDGVITQDQADQLLEEGAHGRFGKPGGMHGMGGRGGMRGPSGDGFFGPRGRGGMPGQSGM